MTPPTHSAAYVDSSALIAIVRLEPTAEEVRTRINGFHTLLSSNLLEAEMRAAFARDGQTRYTACSVAAVFTR